jgi:glycosyltransferase involved in cell wall biosynthesis
MGQLKHSESVWELLRGDEENLPLEAFPKVSVVIPTKNHGAEIAFTLESLLAQDYPHLEIVIIDAHSTDRTLEIAKSFRSEKIRILSVSQYALSEMWNRGLMATKGDYLSFLEPGTTYLFPRALRHMMRLVREAEHPLLVYSSYLKRVRRGENQLILNPLDQELLAQGITPTSFEACWFSIEAFKRAGTFSTDYHLQSGFEFLSRLSKLKGNVFAVTTRVVTDMPLRLKRKGERWVRIKEKWRAVRRHFGLGAALKLMLRAGTSS